MNSLRKIVFLGTLASLTTFAIGAEIEFLDGNKISGRTLSKSQTHLKVEIEIAGKKQVREFELTTIHRVVINDKVYVLNEKESAPESQQPGDESASIRSRQEVLDLVNQQGRVPPDWYRDAKLDYPDTLDLQWPKPAPKPWNNKKNVGQYIWDVINPNTSRWPNGIRLMHFLLTKHQDDRELRSRIMRSLGSMYFRFYQDYPRAAFWWRQAGVKKGDQESVQLAECYWRLGNKQMARQMIDDRRIQVGTIKLLGDMGETRTALRYAEAYAKTAREPHFALLAAGDACRTVARFEDAIEYYQRVLDSPKMRSDPYDKRARTRAKEGIETIQLFEFADAAKAADGTYQGNSLGYEGPLAVDVKIADGKIEAVRITKHKEKQYYSALRDVPQQIIEKQGVKGVDATSRATITANAVIRAAASAIADAARQNGN